MIKTKKQMFMIIGAFILTILLGTTTYAFFNYTRTGASNVIKTGRIYFNSEQGNAINLTNVFPVDVSNGIPNNNPNVGSVTINVTGDTTYTEGIEYLVSAVNVQNTVGNKSLPISIDVDYSANGNGKVIGTEDEEYFDNRGGNSSLYRVLTKGTITNNEELVVGYIAPGQEGIDGNIVIRAYIDASKVAITDTYPEQTVRTVKTTGYSSSDCETVLTGVTNAGTYCATAEDLQDAIDEETLTAVQIALLVNAGIVDEYTDGTTSSWVGDRTVFTTNEWNSLQTNGVSFQVKVESNEGTWVEEVLSINAMNTFPDVITNEKANIKEVYFNKMGATRMQNAYNTATIKADLTYNNEGKVLAWLETNQDDNTKYNLIVASDGDTYLPNNCFEMFSNYLSVEKVEFNNVNASRTTIMVKMFYNCSNLVDLIINNYIPSSVEYTVYMFSGCSSLERVDLNMLDISNVTSPSYMFYNCISLKTVDLSNLDTSKVLNSQFSELFTNCSSLQTVYVSSTWNVSSQLSGVPMFNGCTSLVGGNGTHYDESNPKDKTYAIIDGINGQPGYFTDIADKPTA